MLSPRAGDRLALLKLAAEDCRVLAVQVQLVQSTTHRYGGQVTRLICDDKGVRFLIAFGLPGQASEDDERREANLRRREGRPHEPRSHGQAAG